jgi:hypothetical protein
MPKYSENAFNCSKCPENGGYGGCPAWWEIVWEKPNTDEVKVEKGCGLEMMPKLLLEVLKASNRPAAAVESMRNEMKKDFGSLLSLASVAVSKQIEGGNGDKS